MIKLEKLLERIGDYKLVTGRANVDVSGATMDSRQVTRGSLFVARRGDLNDGHQFVSDAINRGAGSVVGESFTEEHLQKATRQGVTMVQVQNSVHEGGVMIAAFYGFPFLKMTMIGVTGTDGKTTTSNAVYDILKSQGKKVGLISTVSAKVFDGQSEAEMETGLHVTTPEVNEIQRLLAQMVEQGCEYAVVEATSHGFVQGRLVGINFDVVGITNVTHEHTDYHQTFENYLSAKAKIWGIDSTLPKKNLKRIGYINADDEKSAGFRAYAKDWDLRTFSIEGRGILNATIKETGLGGSQFVIGGQDYQTKLVGKYNIANVTLAIGLCQAIGVTFEEMVEGVRAIESPPGRFEVIDTPGHGKVVIDFAHTPNAMEQVVSFVRNHNKGKLFLVFGCAGLRDVEKRAMMGKIAGRLADLTIVTAEDPRTERVADISKQIVAGLESVGATEIKIQDPIFDLRSEIYDKRCYLQIEDRYEAIRTVIMAAQDGDVAMILGKGHEKSMCYGTIETPWNDREAVEKVIKELERV